MLRVLLCIFVRMLPGMSRALELILAENDLPAGGSDNREAGAEQEGTSLPPGCGARRPARATPGLSVDRASPQEATEPHRAVSRPVWGLRV